MNPIRKFYIKHPKFRRYFDVVTNYTILVAIASYILAFVLIMLPILGLYISLPDDIRIPATAITGGLLSISIFPLITDNINKRTDIQNEQFNRLHEFYINLSQLIITALRTEDNNKIRDLSEFIKDNYPTMCIDMPQKLIDCLLNLKDECDIKLSPNINANSDMKTFSYFAEKCMKIIRKQGNVEGAFTFIKH